MKLIKVKNQVLWKKQNKHNHTHLQAIDGSSIDAITVGKGTYGGLRVLAHSQDSCLIIGSFCSIAPGVCFVLGSEHPTNHLSTYPFKVHYLDEKHEAISKGNIVVGDDVWFGVNSIVLSGVKIGQGAIIGAGSVVTHDIPPYAIVGGVPAKVIKYRFEKETIDILLKLDYSKLTNEILLHNISSLYLELDKKDESSIREILRWFPKKEGKNE